MLPIYESIADDLKVSKGSPALLPTQHVVRRSLTGIKIGLSVSFALVTAAVLGIGYLYYSFENEVRERKTLQISHVTLSERTAAIENTLDDYRGEMAKLTERLNASQLKDQGTINEIKRDIEKRRFEIMNLQKKVRLIEGQSVSSAPSMEAVAKEASSVSNASEAPSAEPIKTAATTTTPAQPAADTVAKPSAPAESAAANERVLTINRKFQFVVVNVGLEDSIREGDQFEVVREGTTIGRVEVEKLYDSFSAATIIKEDKEIPIEVGDAVRKIS